MANIAFAGLTAAGKTTHARRLAADLGYSYVSATDILFEILQMPAGAHPWFTQLDVITAAREGDAVDDELESRLVDLARTRDRTVFDSWALAWICPAPIVRIWIESDPPSRARKCLVSLGDEPHPLAECEAVLRAKDGHNRAVFRNQNNSTDLVITRRWTALQAPNGVVTTIRFRDAAVRMPYQLACSFPAMAKDITVTGQVADADLGNLFPRLFRVVTAGYTYTVHLWWWKFASPVRDGDTITIRGSRSDLLGHDVIRVSSFTSHWLQIHNP